MREETRQKIQQYEVAPPPSVWAGVESALDDEVRPLVPFWVRYAAAILLLAVGGMFWYRLANTPPVTEQATTRLPEPTVAIPQASLAAAPPESPAPLTMAGSATTNPVPENNTPAALPRHAAVNHALVSLAPISLRNPLNIPAAYLQQFRQPLNTNYFYLPGPTGETMRISRKLALAMKNELNLKDLPSPYSNREMQQLTAKISSWKNRIVNSPYIPSAENFLDLVSLMEMPEDK